MGASSDSKEREKCLRGCVDQERNGRAVVAGVRLGAEGYVRCLQTSNALYGMRARRSYTSHLAHLDEAPNSGLPYPTALVPGLELIKLHMTYDTKACAAEVKLARVRCAYVVRRERKFGRSCVVLGGIHKKIDFCESKFKLVFGVCILQRRRN